jgi:hypothetical protein
MIPKTEANSPPNFHGFNKPFNDIEFGGLGKVEMPTAESIRKALKNFDPSKFWRGK